MTASVARTGCTYRIGSILWQNNATLMPSSPGEAKQRNEVADPQLYKVGFRLDGAVGRESVLGWSPCLTVRRGRG
jgi:hypothetical protein